MRIVNRGTRLHKATWAEHMWQKTPNALTVTWDRNGIRDAASMHASLVLEQFRDFQAEMGRMGIL